MKSILLFLFCFCLQFVSHSQTTPFEKSKGMESATYFQAIEFYKKLAGTSSRIAIKEQGPTDAAYPLHLVLVSNDSKFDPAVWHKQGKVVILINNGIHPGEPDGIDASMMLVRDIANNKIKLPNNVALAIIPVYNIGGCLNRNAFSRVNQNGPLEYGFRGNSQNLDLNRDFTKCDSKEAQSFAKLFHYLDPDILIDNHVSDGADYQHTMTLLTGQYDKLGGRLGEFLKYTFEPSLYTEMAKRKWDMVPYVNFETLDIQKGMTAFYDPPRYSSGYAALFQTIAFVPETHMLKPFADRVRSTYDLMRTVIQQVAIYSTSIRMLRVQTREKINGQKTFALAWVPDSTKADTIVFKGYEQGYKTSGATGLSAMYYDHSKPYTKKIKYYNQFNPSNTVNKPRAYLIPHGWQKVIELLKLNNVTIEQLSHDSMIEVNAYHIDDYKSYARPYEKHHKNYEVKVSSSKQKIKFLKGDYIIPMGQAFDRYIVEMLEPTGDDSFFAWNFFDAILQQKEGYSDYRWEDIAADVLQKDPGLKKRLEDRRAADTSFAHNSEAQLDFIYKNSPYYEPVHLRYPVYRLN